MKEVGMSSSEHLSVRGETACDTTIETQHDGYVDRGLRRAVGDILNVEQLYPLISIMRNNMEPFEYLVDYYGHRYHLLLEHNDAIEDAIENIRLQELSCVMRCGNIQREDEEVLKCLSLFWPYVAKDCDQRGSKSPAKPSIKDRLALKPVIKIRLKTLADGVLFKTSHDAFINYPLSDPIENPCPELHLFKKDEIELLSEISTNVFKAKIDGGIYCLKIAEREKLLREITILAGLPSHPSLPRLTGLVSAGEGKVDQFVTPFIFGETLANMKGVSEKRKSELKRQISGVVNFLHDNDIVWGDVNPRNVMIESDTDRVVLTDFAGGACTGWVDVKLRDSKDGDIQGLGRLLSFIDELRS